MFITDEIVDRKYHYRREVVFIVLVGVFLGTLSVLNILGISRQLDLSFSIGSLRIPFKVFVGILPYPITFLCTDFISELYGKRRANLVVWVGLILNIWVLFILWLGGKLPPHPEMINGLPALDDPAFAFFQMRKWAFGATLASMIAYLTAQFIDVHIFHYFKKLTKGKHLWLRNNGSTLTSQLVDSVAVVVITFFYAPNAIQIESGHTAFQTVMIIILSTYAFKFVTALLDTIPFYYGVSKLSVYLKIDPNAHIEDSDEVD